MVIVFFFRVEFSYVRFFFVCGRRDKLIICNFEFGLKLVDLF